MQAVAATLALVAVACLLIAVKGMITGRPNDRTGGALRAAALVSFIAAVIVNTLR
jgi:hypothetical protein